MNHLEKEPFEDINVNGARIRLVGTAHVSQASTDFVIEQIEKGSYDCVAVELFFFKAEDGIRAQPRSRGLGDVYKRQLPILTLKVRLEYILRYQAPLN